MSKLSSAARRWIRVGVDYGAPIAFAVTYFGFGKNVMLATGVLVGASVLAVIVGGIVERRLAPLPLIAGVFAVVFGGLTLVFRDETFVQIKITAQNGLFALALLGGVSIGKNPLKALLGENIRMEDAAWRHLTIRYGVYFIAVAIANEVVRNTYDFSFWLKFRTALLPLALVFSLSQVPFMMKNLQKPEEGDAAPEPPDPGV
ncbi:MAG: inner membrane-spanning protein YciB [Caulobacter sp.]|nr:inner membrane-spanning protein YciB [Caulobacter sp.]